MLPHKVFWLALGGVAAAVFGMLSALFGSPAGWPTLVATALALVATWFGGRVVHGHDVFDPWLQVRKQHAVRWIGAAAVSDATAVAALQLIGIRWWFGWLVGVALLVGFQIGVAHVLELLWFRLKPAKAAAADPSSEPPAGAAPVTASGVPGAELVVRPMGSMQPDHVRTVVRRNRSWDELSSDERIMKAALLSTTYKWLDLMGYEELRDSTGRAFGASFIVRVPASKLAADGADKCVLPATAAEPIAIALSEYVQVAGEAYGVLPSRFVGVRKLPQAGLYKITVVTEDVMARIYPFNDDLGRNGLPFRRSIKDPMLFGYGLDTLPVMSRVTRHAQLIGGSRNGKTSLEHALLAQMTQCAGNDCLDDDALVWIGGMEKIYDMVAGWLECYMDQPFDIPFDWIMCGAEDTLTMLIRLMEVARYRQSVPMQQREWPTIILIIDEASFVLRNTSVVGIYQGEPVLMSDMGGMITQGAGSADCWLHYLTQRDTNDQLGDKGGDIAAQTGITAAFRINDQQTIGRLTGDYKLRMPTHPGEYWLRMVDEDDALEVKAPYPQEVDPTKPKLHDGATLADLSWARRFFPRRGLEPGSARVAGPEYRLRHRRMNADLQAYLTGRGRGTTSPLATPVAAPGGAEGAGAPATSVQSGAQVGVAPDLWLRTLSAEIVQQVVDIAIAKGGGDAVRKLSARARRMMVEQLCSGYESLAELMAWISDPDNPDLMRAPAGIEPPRADEDEPVRPGPVQDTMPITVPAQTAGPESPIVVSINQPKRGDLVAAVVREAAGPLAPREIQERLAERGHEALSRGNAVSNVLRQLVDDGALVRLQDAAGPGSRYGVTGRVYETAEATANGDAL